MVLLSMPGGYIPTLETKQRECWKFETRDVNSEFESRVSVQPSNIPAATLAWFIVPIFYILARYGAHIPRYKRWGKLVTRPGQLIAAYH